MAFINKRTAKSLAGITIPAKKSWDFFNAISKQGCDFGHSN
jgi:hypothetical protein